MILLLLPLLLFYALGPIRLGFYWVKGERLLPSVWRIISDVVVMVMGPTFAYFIELYELLSIFPEVNFKLFTPLLVVIVAIYFRTLLRSGPEKVAVLELTFQVFLAVGILMNAALALDFVFISWVPNLAIAALLLLNLEAASGAANRTVPHERALRNDSLDSFLTAGEIRDQAGEVYVPTGYLGFVFGWPRLVKYVLLFVVAALILAIYYHVCLLLS